MFPDKGKIEENLFALSVLTIVPDLSLRQITIKKATESYHIFSTFLIMFSVKLRLFKNQKSPLNSVLEIKVLVHDCGNMALSFFYL